MLAAVRMNLEVGENIGMFWLIKVGLLLGYLVQMVGKQSVLMGDNS